MVAFHSVFFNIDDGEPKYNPATASMISRQALKLKKTVIYMILPLAEN